MQMAVGSALAPAPWQLITLRSRHRIVSSSSGIGLTVLDTVLQQVRFSVNVVDAIHYQRWHGTLRAVSINRCKHNPPPAPAEQAVHTYQGGRGLTVRGQRPSSSSVAAATWKSESRGSTRQPGAIRRK